MPGLVVPRMGRLRTSRLFPLCTGFYLELFKSELRATGELLKLWAADYSLSSCVRWIALTEFLLETKLPPPPDRS